MKGLLALLCLFHLSIGLAKDYEVMGKTYPIAEQDFLEYIQQKLGVLEANGDLEKAQSEFKKQVKAHLIRPTPTHLPRTVEDRISFFNPSFAAPFDVWDTNEQLIVKKGTVINPLDRVNLSSTLLFFDGDDEAQLNWVAEELKHHTKVKLILASGSIKDTAHHFKQAIYFDLNGFLITKFHIASLPARIQQVGQRLQISEVTV